MNKGSTIKRTHDLSAFFCVCSVPNLVEECDGEWLGNITEQILNGS